jgi:hypothetical protein
MYETNSRIFIVSKLQKRGFTYIDFSWCMWFYSNNGRLHRRLAHWGPRRGVLPSFGKATCITVKLHVCSLSKLSNMPLFETTSLTRRKNAGDGDFVHQKPIRSLLKKRARLAGAFGQARSKIHAVDFTFSCDGCKMKVDCIYHGTCMNIACVDFNDVRLHWEVPVDLKLPALLFILLSILVNPRKTFGLSWFWARLE